MVMFIMALVVAITVIEGGAVGGGRVCGGSSDDGGVGFSNYSAL